MNLFTVLFFSVFFFFGPIPAAFSNCAVELTRSHAQDSSLHSFSYDEIDQWAIENQMASGADDLESAKTALSFLYESLYCQNSPQVDAENSACSQVKMGRSFSSKCYLETKEGYFFVHRDLLDNVHLHYHRWD